MAKKRGKTASRVLTVIMVMALLFVASGNVFISASAAELGTTIYLQTDKTTTPYIHYWDANEKGSAWPGVAMTKVDGETDIYSYDLPYDVSSLKGVIFLSDGSGSKLTEDLTNITDNLYVLSSNTWSHYDASPIKIKEFTVDPAGPQYTGSTISLTANAEGGDNLQYKFSVSGAKDEVISDFSSNKTASWVPTVAGNYTVKLDVKDSAGETNSRQLDYEVKDLEDAKNGEDPVFLNATPSNNSEIQKGGDTTVRINAVGGKVNNNLLFYKAEVTDPNGKLVNTAYYQLGNRITFSADLLGTYTVKMYVQNNTVANKTVIATYTYSSVNDPVNSDTDVISDVDSESDSEIVTDSDTESETDTLTDSDSETDTQSDTDTLTDTDSETDVETDIVSSDTDSEVHTDSEDTDTASDTDTTTDSDEPVSDTDTSTDSDTDTEPKSDVIGDFDGDGKVTLKDAYNVQSAAIGKGTLTAEQFKRVDVNGDGKITLKDASMIQQHLAGIVLLGSN